VTDAFLKQYLENQGAIYNAQGSCKELLAFLKRFYKAILEFSCDLEGSKFNFKHRFSLLKKLSSENPSKSTFIKIINWE
jgi:hypothetical protein